MNNSIKNVKPKANKLLQYIQNFPLSLQEKNKELGLSLQELALREDLPEPVQIFFEMPSFKKLIRNLAKGKLYKKTKNSQISQEIEKLHTLGESFHKIVHLDYHQRSFSDPILHAKLLSKNIYEYLSTCEFLKGFSGKHMNKILAFLKEEVMYFTEELIALIEENKEMFSDDLQDLRSDSTVKSLLQKKQNALGLSTKWFLILLHIHTDQDCPNKHISKLFQQIIHRFRILGDQYQKQESLYIPKSIEKKVKHLLESMHPREKLLGREINQLFQAEFSQEYYAAIRVKEKNATKKLLSMAVPIDYWESYIHQNISDFKNVHPYWSSCFQKMSRGLCFVGTTRHVAVQAILGFHIVQYDYMQELLHGSVSYGFCAKKKALLKSLLQDISNFLNAYYLSNPMPTFLVVQDRLENLYHEDELEQKYSPKEVLQKLDEVFKKLLPQDPMPIENLTSLLIPITKKLADLQKELHPNSIEYKLLEEKLQYFSHVDLPSYAHTWNATGEIIALVCIFLQKADSNFIQTLQGMLEQKKHLSFFPS